MLIMKCLYSTADYLAHKEALKCAELQIENNNPHEAFREIARVAYSFEMKGVAASVVSEIINNDGITAADLFRLIDDLREAMPVPFERNAAYEARINTVAIPYMSLEYMQQRADYYRCMLEQAQTLESDRLIHFLGNHIEMCDNQTERRALNNCRKPVVSQTNKEEVAAALIRASQFEYDRAEFYGTDRETSDNAVARWHSACTCLDHAAVMLTHKFGMVGQDIHDAVECNYAPHDVAGLARRLLKAMHGNCAFIPSHN